MRWPRTGRGISKNIWTRKEARRNDDGNEEVVTELNTRRSG